MANKKYNAIMERLANIKAAGPLLDIIESLSNLRVLFLSERLNGNGLEKRAFVYAKQIIKNYLNKWKN